MAEAAAQEITRLLKAWGGGDAAALEKLTPLVYDELHGIAHRAASWWTPPAQDSPASEAAVRWCFS